MIYKCIKLLHPLAFKPGWVASGTGGTRDSWAYEAPEYAITRDKGDPVYTVTHVQSGEACEVPCGNVRGAELAPQAQKARRV